MQKYNINLVPQNFQRKFCVSTLFFPYFQGLQQRYDTLVKIANNLYPTYDECGDSGILGSCVATRGNSNLIEQLVARDQQLSDTYHKIADGKAASEREQSNARNDSAEREQARPKGKWSKMMQDKHIGYTQWYMPKDNIPSRNTILRTLPVQRF